MTATHRDFSCRLVGSRATAHAPSFALPHLDDRVEISGPDGERTEHLGTRSSYTYQLEALTRTVRAGEPFPTDADDAVATMGLIDACYRAAGLAPRPGALHAADGGNAP
jgi:predicted dehydrogenase